MKGTFTKREIALIGNCRTYNANDPAGLPGHNLMVIITKMANMLDTLVQRQSVNASRKAIHEWLEITGEVEVKP